MADKVIIDEDECIGCEVCVETCPSVFGFNEDDAKAFVIEDSDANEECVEEAVSTCPAECITTE